VLDFNLQVSVWAALSLRVAFLTVLLALESLGQTSKQEKAENRIFNVKITCCGTHFQTCRHFVMREAEYVKLQDI